MIIRTKSNWEGIAFDSALVLTCFLWLSAGSFLITWLHGEAKMAASPWMHRFSLSLLTLTMFLWALRTHPESKIIHGIKKLSIPSCRWVSFFFLLAACLWTTSSWLRHDAFLSGFDMAIFDQAVWNTLQGAPLYSSIKGGICLLGDHFSPILFAYVIPYALWSDPKCLLLIQAVCAAACIFPLFKIAKKMLLSDLWAIAFVIAFFLYLPVQNSVRFDFHPEMAAMPCFFWAFYCLKEKRLFLTSTWLLIALLCKENAALVTACFGLYTMIVNKNFVFGVSWILFSLIYFIVVLYFLIPAFSHEQYFYLNGNYFDWRNEGWASFSKYLFSLSSLGYLFKIFVPLGFLSFLSPTELLLTLPALAQNLLARNLMTRSIFHQYTIFLTPFVFISAVAGAKKIIQKKWALPYFFSTTLLFAGVPESYVISQNLSHLGVSQQRQEQFLHNIPSEFSVRAHEFLAPHLAHRKELHIFENQHPKEGGAPKALRSKLIILDRNRFNADPVSTFDDLRKKGYSLKQEEGNLSLWVKDLS